MQVVVYRKPGCSLCDEADELLDEARELFAFTVEHRNILERDDWFQAYRYRVPVVVVNGIEALELRFTPEALALALSVKESST